MIKSDLGMYLHDHKEIFENLKKVNFRLYWNGFSMFADEREGRELTIFTPFPVPNLPLDKVFFLTFRFLSSENRGRIKEAAKKQCLSFKFLEICEKHVNPVETYRPIKVKVLNLEMDKIQKTICAVSRWTDMFDDM